MRRARASTLVAASAAALAAAVAASAAGVGVVSARLTSTSASSSVAASACSLSASAADAYVDGAVVHLNSNFGSSPDLSVQSSALETRHSFVGFDLGACAIPASARVSSATFTLFMSQAPSSNRTYEVRRATDAWVEGTLTWSNQPAVAGTATATGATGTTSGVTVAWTVTSDVQAFVAGTLVDNGWRVADTTEDALPAVDASFGSRERASASEKPTLVVTYYP